jgi:hypothetical protein
MLGHDPRGFLRERVPQMFTANAQSFCHAPIIWPVRRKIKRSTAWNAQKSGSPPADVCSVADGFWPLTAVPLPGR